MANLARVQQTCSVLREGKYKDVDVTEIVARLQHIAVSSYPFLQLALWLYGFELLLGLS